MRPRPSVLFILADTFRADSLGVAGHPVVQTPSLDGLAREGALFTNFFVQSCPCGPSRMCTFTSRYLCSTRSVDNMTPLVDAEENVAAVLRSAGYRPGFIGYNDYAVDPRILPEGDPRTTGLSYANVLPGFDVVLMHEYDSPEYFDYLRARGYPDWLCRHEAVHTPNVPPEGPGEHLPLWYPAHYRAEDSEARFVTRRAIDYLTERRDGGWVLSLNYIKPHPPRICPAPYHRMYDGVAMPTPARRPEELSDPHPYLQMLHRDPQLVTERDLRETQANYYGMITELDACLGELFQALRDTGQWDSTLVVFSADHGEYLGDHYLTDKSHFYDGALRVPCIVRDPSAAAGATRGARLEGFAESVDLSPTVLEYLGVPQPDRFQGQSLLGQVRGRPGARGKAAAFYEFDFRGAFRGDPSMRPDECVLWVVRDGAWKYVQFGAEALPPLLFDLRADPQELVNLADRGDHAAVVAAYCQRLLRWRMRHEDQRMEHWASQYRA